MQLLGKVLALEIAGSAQTNQEPVLRDLLRADPQCAFAYSRLIGLLAYQRRFAEVETLVTEFLRRRPDVCDAHLSAARLHLTKNEPAAAERAMREAWRRHRGCPGASEGVFVLSLGRLEPGDTREFLEETFRLHPNQEQTRIFLAYTRA